MSWGNVIELNLCVRCGQRSLIPRLGATCMRWPVGVDYIDDPEPETHALWICGPCWDRNGVELYWPAYGFHLDELQALCARYDPVYQTQWGITGSPWLN